MPKHIRAIIRCGARPVVVLVTVSIALMAIGYKIGPEKIWPLALLQYTPHALLLMPVLLSTPFRSR